MNDYTILDDNLLRAVWACPECKDTVECNVWDYQNVGTPYCADCDEDMVYIQTRLYKKNYRERLGLT